MITVTQLTRTYTGKVPVQALKGVTFDVAQGEFVAIMGRSGSGKSTLLHLLGLLDEPTSGDIMLNGIKVGPLSDRKKIAFRLQHLGYVFQEYALLPELTALESVYLPLKLAGAKQSTYISRAEQVLDAVGLKERLDHFPHELSGGEQQRVAVARAIVNTPKILFADEPCANLDTQSTKTILALLRQINKQHGQTIVMVTHEPEDEQYVDRVIRLQDGLIVEEKAKFG